MKLAKYLGTLLALSVLAFIFYLVFVRDKTERFKVSALEQTVQAKDQSADDPTYAQEIRALTAKLKRTEKTMQEKTSKEDAEKRKLQDDINTLTTKVRELDNDDRLAEMQELMQKVSEQNAQVEVKNSQLKEQLREISESIASIQTLQQDKDQQIASLTEQLSNNQPPTATLDSSLIEDRVKAIFANQYANPQAENGYVAPAQDTALQSASRDHKPYSISSEESSETTGLKAVNLAGLVSKFSEDPIASLGVPIPGDNQNGEDSTTELPVFPVYTLPVTTMLTDSVLLTPLVGRVPIGANINDPFRFQLEIGTENLAANGHSIPGIQKAIASGVAIGNREQSCVRGAIDTLTFIFQDGRIHTVGENANKANDGLGYLADSYGKPCIFGQYINNAGSYLKGRSIAAFLEGLANAYGQSQVERRETSSGALTTFISGSAYEFAAAQGLSNTAAEISDYVRERSLSAFDVVYVPQASSVQIILQKQIEIDYDLNARKTSYLKSNKGVTYD